MPASYPDKYHLTKDQNRRYARQNFVNLVHTNSRFEGVNTTLLQTQTIMDGLGVDGVSIDDINVIVQLKKGWQLITEDDASLTLAFEKKINAIVALHDSLAPGELRTGQGGVDVGTADYFTPPAVDPNQESRFLTDLMQDDQRSTTDKALTLLYHNMRQQLFWDGNKRTATLAANKLMIDHGAGLINVPLNLWPRWNELISAYYQSADMTAIKEWTYAHAIQGVALN
ncbi:Fic family protein [Schleiferilactobacillus harbinensis]|uniref:Fic family protein n=1 Tax=Schleiferilactobacillus harbinensis TaxID=304207 RepID=A0ABU7T057_9LACO